ncbi:MAG: PIN domain-containing protein [Rhodanobacteraceae bacterium]|nr:MAG: PIN domain-containing protein [Rhodanobacteraceae bacterium]
MRVFVDTNLWVYRLDRRQPEKSRFIAGWLRELAEQHEIVVSTQVLIELRAVLSGKLKPVFSAADTRAALKALAVFEVVDTNANLVLDAHELAVRERFSWFDALIAEAAIRSRCAILYSEDFNHGRRLDNMAIVNPFKSGVGD